MTGVRTLARRVAAGSAVVATAGCGGWSGATAGCRAAHPPAALPGSVQEASGVAVSVAHPGVYWVINDSKDPHLHAVGSDGSSRGRVRVAGARQRDWEDLALAPCGQGHCLYIADVGDNYGTRDSVAVYRVPEPDPEADSVVAEAFFLRYPDGARNVEAIFVTPDEGVHLVSKGTDQGVTVYRYPGALRSDSTKTVVEVQHLSEESKLLPRQITGGAASHDGALVALRTYETFGFYRIESDTLRLLEDGVVNLRTLQEAQGEGIAFGTGGEIALVSEAGPMGRQGSIVVLRCELPETGR